MTRRLGDPDVKSGKDVTHTLAKLGQDDGLAFQRTLMADAMGALVLGPDDLPPDVLSEAPEPAVRSCYQDCRHPYLPVGYTDRPKRTRVVSLSRDRYLTADEAQVRFDELQAKHSWKLVGHRFWTVCYWCFRIEVPE